MKLFFWKRSPTFAHRSLFVAAARSYSVSAMPPNSMVRICCMCSSVFGAVHSSAQAAIPSSTRSACVLRGKPIHVEHAGHDLVNRVERRPHALAPLEPVPPRGRKGAEVFAAQPLLASSPAPQPCSRPWLSHPCRPWRRTAARWPRGSGRRNALAARSSAGRSRAAPIRRAASPIPSAVPRWRETCTAAGPLPAAPCTRGSIPARRERCCPAAASLEASGMVRRAAAMSLRVKSSGASNGGASGRSGRCGST